MAAHNWRAIRQRYQDKGIPDVMGSVPTMHAVLDVMENLGAESAVQGSKTEMEGREKLSRFYDLLYKPDLSDIARIVNGSDDELLKPPPGFEDDEVEASFDAFMSAANSR